MKTKFNIPAQGRNSIFKGKEVFHVVFLNPFSIDGEEISIELDPNDTELKRHLEKTYLYAAVTHDSATNTCSLDAIFGSDEEAEPVAGHILSQ